MPNQYRKASEGQRSRPVNRHNIQPNSRNVFGELKREFQRSRARSANTRVQGIKDEAHNRRRSLSPDIRQKTSNDQLKQNSPQRKSVQFGTMAGPTTNNNNFHLVPNAYRQERSSPQNVNYDYDSSRLYNKSPSPRNSPSHYGSRSPNTERKSDLVTKFDPMKDRHMWAMWRTAINDRLTDQIRYKEQESNNAGPRAGMDRRSSGGPVFADSPAIYDRDITSAAPMNRLVQLSESSVGLVRDMTEQGGGMLRASQFLYYGIPRVTISDTGTNSAVSSRYNNA